MERQIETWACFPEDGPPELVILGWRQLLALPAGARQNLWALLYTALEDPSNPENRQLIEGYAQRFDANAGNVLAAVRACDYLLRQAAALNVGEAAFRADVERLAPGDRAGADLLMPRFNEVMARLRERLLERTLADHGNVLTGFDWRMDKVQLSSHGQMGDVSVLLLCLRYKRQNVEKQLSLQLTPRALASLQSFFAQFSPTD